MPQIRSPRTPKQARIHALPIRGDARDQQKATIQLIGKAIVDGSRYLPIRHRASRLAARAKSKDYLGQVREIYNDFIKRWRYVKDPVGRELVATNPQRVFEMVMGGDGQGPGAGDCDDATVGIGAQIASIGIPVRIATIAPPDAPAGPLMTHVFAQANIPDEGWVTVDPVVHPTHGFGYTPPFSRLTTWDLNGALMSQQGNTRGLSAYDGLEGVSTMLGEFDVNRFVDYAGLGDCAPSHGELPDFRVYGIRDYGIYSDQMGMLGGMGLAAEVDDDDMDDYGRAWTPMIEFAPHDYAYLTRRRKAYDGMMGVGDNGAVYEYNGEMGFFKKLFRRIKRGVKKVARRAKNIARKLIRKIPGGKYLLKLGKKVWKISKKLIKPLMKFVGPLASKLAPVAALIPGWGPAIAAGLHMTGKIAKTMKQMGVKLATAKDGLSRLKFPSGAVAKEFQKEMQRSARKLAKSQKVQKRAKRGAIRRGIAPKPRRRGRRMVRRPSRRAMQARMARRR